MTSPDERGQRGRKIGLNREMVERSRIKRLQSEIASLRAQLDRADDALRRRIVKPLEWQGSAYGFAETALGAYFFGHGFMAWRPWGGRLESKNWPTEGRTEDELKALAQEHHAGLVLSLLGGVE